MFGERVFQQTIGIPVGPNFFLRYSTICFPHAYEADFLQGLVKNKDRKLKPLIPASAI